MNLFFQPDGTCICLYSETPIDLRNIGNVEKIDRFTSVEPLYEGDEFIWQVRDTDGKTLYKNASRINCLQWEEKHFNKRMENKK